MKHEMDWEAAELLLSYQERYKIHQISIALPPEIILELSQEFGPLPEIPERYRVRTSLSWLPVHPFFGTPVKQGIRIKSKSEKYFQLQLYPEDHTPMELGVSLTPRKAKEHTGMTKGAGGVSISPSVLESRSNIVSQENKGSLRPAGKDDETTGPKIDKETPVKIRKIQVETEMPRVKPSQIGRNPVYLSAADLSNRCWTRTMIGRYLGEPDSIQPVNHFLNYRGKAVWLLQRIVEAETRYNIGDSKKDSDS